MRKGSLSKVVTLALSASLLLGNLTICGVSVANAEGRTSQVNSTVTEGNEKLPAPINFKANIISNNVLVASWNPIQDAETYTLFVDDKEVYHGADTTRVVNDIIPSEVHTLEVYASRATIAGEKAIITVNTPEIFIPFPPGHFYVTTNETTLTATWDAVSDAEGYKVFIDNQLVYNGPDLTYKATELTPDTTYVVELVSFNSAGESGKVKHTSKTKDPAKMPAPTNIKAETTSNSATISWDAVEGANHYWVIFNNNQVYSGPNLTTVATNLGSDRPYSVYVYAIKMGDNGVIEKGEQGYLSIVTKPERKVETPETPVTTESPKSDSNESTPTSSSTSDSTSASNSATITSNNNNSNNSTNKSTSSTSTQTVVDTKTSENSEANQEMTIENKINFSDISGNFAEEAIKSLTKSGLLKGYADGTFAPNKKISRAEFAILAKRAIGIEKKSLSIVQSFKDLNENAWYVEELQIALDNGITTGYDDGTFRPNLIMQREQAAVMLANILMKNNFKVKSEEAVFIDNNISAWAKSSIQLLQSYKIVEGQNNFFYPKREITRAETAVMIYRLLDVLSK